MFAMFKLCAILALAAPFASALSITTVSGNAVSEGSLTITWTTSTSDQYCRSGTFSIELDHPSFNNALALANNVDSSTLTTTVALPNVPADSGYTIEFVDISNINSVFATSASFSIGAVSATQSTTVTGVPLPSSSASKSASSASKSASVTGSGSASSNPISTKPAVSPSGFGTTGPASSIPTSSSVSAPSTSPSAGSNGALAVRGSVAGALLVAVGVAAIAL
ncbi:hypothetical protein C8R44DRAFT_70139 [Mycena epipterygia]|nr:hypothetical protein C8R44DRAFT_70139 [Mycena epipterygia]